MELGRMFAMDARPKLALAFVFSLTVVLFLSSVAHGQTITRHWSDNSGEFSIQAQLLKINSASVTLKKPNQIVIEVPFSRLSEVDLDFVKNKIAQRNGVPIKPAQQIAPKRLVGSSAGSGTKINRADSSLANNINKQNSGASSRKPAFTPKWTPKSEKTAKPEPKQAPLRYAAKPEDSASDSLALSKTASEPFSAPMLPDEVPGVIPTKDDTTKLQGSASRLKPASNPQSQFSLGSPSPKKPPIVLLSPQVGEAKAKPIPKSPIPIESALKNSPSRAIASRSISSTNDLRSSNSNSASSANNLRSQPFAPNRGFNSTRGIDANKKVEQLTSQKDQKKFFQPKSSTTPKIPATTNEFKAGGDFSGGSDSAIVLTEDPTSQFVQRIPTSEPAIQKFKAPKNAAVAYHYENVEFRPKSVELVSSFSVSQESLDELPPGLRRLADQVIQANSPSEVRAAVTRIKSDWPSQRYTALVSLLQQCVSDPSVGTRVLGIETLALRDPDNSFEYIVSGIDDPAIDVREATHKAIVGGVSNEEVIRVLAKHLSTDQGQRVALTLSKLGPRVEDHVIPHVRSETLEVQLTACNLLGSIGTKKSIQTLQSIVANSKRTRVRLQASHAIDQINSRSSNQ